MLSDNSHSRLARAPCYRLYFHFIFPTRLEFTWFSSNGRCTAIVRKHFMYYLQFGCVCFDEWIAHVLVHASIANAHGLQSRTMNWRCVMGSERCEKGSRPSQATHSNPKRFNQSARRDEAARAKTWDATGNMWIIIIDAFICMHISSCTHVMQHAHYSFKEERSAEPGTAIPRRTTFTSTPLRRTSTIGLFHFMRVHDYRLQVLIRTFFPRRWLKCDDPGSFYVRHMLSAVHACARKFVTLFHLKKWCRRTRCS